MGVEKMSVPFDLELGKAIRASANASQQSVSAWLAEAARDRLRTEALGHALASWQQAFGPLTDEEIAQADRVLHQRGEKRSGVA